MIILSIETSCDETAVSIVEAVGDFPHATYKILGNALFSQVDIHREYGGVFPEVAKREHAKTLVPMLERALYEAHLCVTRAHTLPETDTETLHTILSREPGLEELLIDFLEHHNRPAIDLIAVTSGPGLEPALWVGINFARALSYAWKVPLVPINHMEGHVLSSIFTTSTIPNIQFPALALLISGGHTELVLMPDWLQFTCIGKTCDDAVGEAFDKVARMLGLSYPGGPEVSARARVARTQKLSPFAKLPRPMIDTPNYQFSFSGLKTAVRYAIEGKVNAEGREGALGQKALTEDEIASVCRDFEDAVTDVLIRKTNRAVQEHGIRTIIVGGGVSANRYIRESFTTFFSPDSDIAVYFPPHNLSTDNSVMVALAGHARLQNAGAYETIGEIKADGNLSL